MRYPPDMDFEHLFNSLPTSSIALDESFTIVAVTDAYLKTTQMTRDKLVGTFVFSLFPENSESKVITTKILAALEHVKISRTGEHFPQLRFDLRSVTTGEYETRYWDITLTPVSTQAGILRYILYQATDITDSILRQRAIDQRFKTIEPFKLLVDNVRDYAIFMLDTEGYVCTWNLGAKRLKGYDESEIIGKHFSRFYVEEDIRNGKPARELRIAKERGTCEDEFWRVRKDGSTFWANVVITVIYDNAHEHLGFAKITRDLTDRKRAESKLIEAYEESARLKSEFLANMSHEIRTPMNGVLAAAALLGDTHMESEQQDLIDIILDSSKALLKIINDILDYSKIEAKELQLSHQPFDLHFLIEKIVTLYTLTTKNADVGVYLTCEGESFIVVGDESRVHQIVLNLVDNAVKFTDRGSVHVHRVMKRNKDTVDIIVSVSDTGIGMSQDTIKKLFRPFAQGDASSRKRYKGTGLGLSICKQLVECMGGTLLIVNSEEGVGSTFQMQLHLPHAESIETAAATAPLRKKLAPMLPSYPQAEILVAEDNKINQIVILKSLHKLGYSHVDIAVDGVDAIAKIQIKKYDAILMDIQMPNMDGLDATRLIRQTGSKIPIIAMTANALKGDDDICISAGMNDYMAKPIDIRLLAEKLEKYLS